MLTFDIQTEYSFFIKFPARVDMCNCLLVIAEHLGCVRR